jgi:molybdopterin-synthase adenylyltransferase
MPANASQVVEDDFEGLDGKMIVVVGAGGTGCFVLPLLAKLKANLTIIDRDVVEESNIERQVLYSNIDVGRPKALVAAARLRKHSSVKAFFEDLNFRNIEGLLHGADFIFDCTDNIDARLLINDYCKKHSKPWVHTSAAQGLGEVILVTKDSACYQCILGDKHGEDCESSGVLLESLKGVSIVAVAVCINHFSESEYNPGLLRLNAAEESILEFKVSKNPDCLACSGSYDYLLGKKRVMNSLCGNRRYMISLGKSLDLDSIASKLAGVKVKSLNALITEDFTILENGRVFVRAFSELDAKKKFAKHVGV